MTEVSRRPNVVVVLFDDVGFADFGCYGSEIATPNIDRLAAGGLQYTNFHTTALCSPTRACLLTGRNHHSVGMGRLASFDAEHPGYRGAVAKTAGMIPAMLRPAGYSSFAVGKWHLAPDAVTSAAGPFDQWPLGRGFDRYYGFLDAATDQWAPELACDNRPIDHPARSGYHLTEDLVDQSIDLLGTSQAIAPHRPFFLYLALGANHAPHHVPKRYVDKYVDVFAKGWDRTRADRLARQIDRGLVPPESRLPPRNDGVDAWDDLSVGHQQFAVRLQAAYAGMLEHADEHLGRLVRHLESSGQLANTVVMVLSDNGASDEGGRFGSLNHRAMAHGAQESLEQQLARLDEIGGPSVMNHYPAGWAMAGNTPLRRYKWTSHAGGVRGPLIVHWPDGIDRPGRRDQFHHVIDICPTVLDVGGTPAPEHLEGVPQQPIEGVGFRYTFNDAAAEDRRHVQYFEVAGCRAIYCDGWKAVAWHRAGDDFGDDHWELYDVAADVTETIDQAADEPERLAQMQRLFIEQAEEHNVFPLMDRRFRRPSNRAGSRRSFRLPNGLRHLPSAHAPDIRNRSYQITADVRMSTQDVGVLIAHGGPMGGYTLYLDDGRLVHDHNVFGTHHVLRSDTPAPGGAHQLGYRFQRTGEHCGVGSLLIDGAVVGRLAIEHTMPTLPQWEWLSVGCDAAAPVGDYQGPNTFTGEFAHVAVELDIDGEGDEVLRYAVAERQQ